MNVLEKILEELENESRLAHEEMRRCARGNPLQFDEVKGYARAMEYVVDTIRSHMDETPKCGECSRRKWYQKGYEDGRKDDGWISVDEGLPEDNSKILCTTEYGEVVLCRYSWNNPHTKKKFFGVGGGAAYSGIIAWQPLPDVYKPEEKSKESN